MLYNLHPLFVHFPIAFLFLYSIIKILPLPKWFPLVSWKHIERALLVFGVIGAFVAMYTGEIAEELVNPNNKLVEMHSFFATISTWVYTLLLVGEALEVIIPRISIKITSFTTLNKTLTFIKNTLTNQTLSTTLAFLGLVAISVTGLLGGVIVYGTSADPVAGIVLKILGIQF